MFGVLFMKLEEQWIVGFVDGEGCFHVSINRHEEMTLGYQVLPEFTVVQHERDVQILHALKAYFGCGVVRTNHGDRMAYRVRNIDHLLKVIVPFFEKHELKSKKRVDFLKFRQVLLKMKDGTHLSQEGIEAIREIKEQMNRSKAKIESDFCGNTEDESSEIPCRVSSDLHEWCNDLGAVSTKDSVKL
jgi:hypothetical protein